MSLSIYKQFKAITSLKQANLEVNRSKIGKIA